MSLAVAELPKLMIECPHGLLRRAQDGAINGRTMLGDRHRRDTIHSRFHRTAQVRGAAPRPVDVGNMNFNFGDAPFEARQPLTDMLLELAVPLRVAGQLIVGMNLDEHWLLHWYSGGSSMPPGPQPFPPSAGNVWLATAPAATSPLWQSPGNDMSAKPADR